MDMIITTTINRTNMRKSGEITQSAHRHTVIMTVGDSCGEGESPPLDDSESSSDFRLFLENFLWRASIWNMKNESLNN